MKTLNVIAVVESATIAQAVEVTYKDFALSVTDDIQFECHVCQCVYGHRNETG